MKGKKTIIQSILMVVLGCLSMQLSAQITLVERNQRNSSEYREYQLEVDSTSTFTVKIINPHGVVQTKPIKGRLMASKTKHNFGFDMQYWLPGSYTIIAENDKGLRYVKKFKIRPRANE